MPIVDGGLCQSPEKAFNSSFSYLCILTSISLQKIQLSHVCLVYLGEDYGDIGRRVGKWEEEGKQGSMKRGKCILSCYLWYEIEWNLITVILSSKEEGHIYISPTHLSLVEDWPCRHLFSRAPSFICSRWKQWRVGRQRTPSGKEEKVLQLEARLAQTDGWGWEAMAVVLVAICHSSFLAPLRCIFDLWWVYSPLLCSLQICGSGYSAG